MLRSDSLSHSDGPGAIPVSAHIKSFFSPKPFPNYAAIVLQTPLTNKLLGGVFARLHVLGCRGFKNVTWVEGRHQGRVYLWFNGGTLTWYRYCKSWEQLNSIAKVNPYLVEENPDRSHTASQGWRFFRALPPPLFCCPQGPCLNLDQRKHMNVIL